MFSFEDLDVYKCTLDFIARSSTLIEDLPKGHSALADQLRRASVSIALNIAESSGRTRRGDSNQHMAIARGSAAECAAILDVFRVLKHVEKKEHAEVKQLLERIFRMLSKMCK